jgi:hypothetical protein
MLAIAGLGEGLRKTFDRRRIGVDVAKYQAMIDEAGVTEEEKRVAIERMWQILVVFVDLGFELHPVEFTCGKNTDENRSQRWLGLSEQVPGVF